jgi:ACR3 family arsenite efflux pump ArsB
MQHVTGNGMLRFNLVFRKYILFWALLAMVIGYLAGHYNPERVRSLKSFLTPLAFVMIFVMIFPSSLSNLAKLKLYLSPLAVSFALFSISPFVAYIVSTIIPEHFQYLRTGIIISSAVPPDAMLSAWAGFLEADLLFTLIIQSFLSCVALLLMPFGLPFFFDQSSYFSLFILVKNLFFLIVIPFASGGLLKIVFRKYLTPGLLRRLKPTLSSISGLMAILIVLISIALNSESISENPVIILWGFFTSSLYYLISFVIGIYVSRAFRLNYEKSIPLIYQGGSRNLSVAMVVALSSFKNQAALGVAACMLSQLPVASFFFMIISKLDGIGRPKSA